MESVIADVSDLDRRWLTPRRPRGRNGRTNASVDHPIAESTHAVEGSRPGSFHLRGLRGIPSYDHRDGLAC